MPVVPVVSIEPRLFETRSRRRQWGEGPFETDEIAVLGEKCLTLQIAQLNIHLRTFPLVWSILAIKFCLYRCFPQGRFLLPF